VDQLTAPGEPPPDDSGPDLSPEERAALPVDSVFRRAVDDRRVRIALIVGLPFVVAVLVAAAIFAQSFGLARSVVVDGSPVLVPGTSTSVLVSYAEMDEYGLPHEIPFERVRLDVCRDAGAAPGGGAGTGDTATCAPLGEARGQGHGKEVEVELTVPAMPAGRHTVHVSVTVQDKEVRYSFPALFDPAASVEPERRENGRVPTQELGRSGVAIDMVALDGGVARGRTSRMILRALGPDGDPYAGTLYLLPVGELAQTGLPPSLSTDAAGLAELELRTESFGFRLAISTVEYPAIDPLEAEVGLLPEDVLDRASVLEVQIRPMLGGLWVRGTVEGSGDMPFLRARGPLVAALDRKSGPTTPLYAEVWQKGRLVRLGSGVSPGAPLDFPGFALPEGVVFVQLHRLGDPVDSVVGRHIWAGATAGASATEVGELIGALVWPAEDLVWAAAVRLRLEELDAGTVERIGRYVLARRDPVWYPLGTLFDSRPTDVARVARVREGIKRAMAWGIGALAAAVLGLAVFFGVSAARQARRMPQPRVDAAPAGGKAGEVAKSSEEQRRLRWARSGALLRIVAVLVIVAIALAGIAVLVWGMKQAYMGP